MAKPHPAYNPQSAPNASTWLALPEAQRIKAVAAFHQLSHEPCGNLQAHTALHVVVENQLAEGFDPTVRALQRLRGEGLSRHEAVHAVAAVLAEHLYAAMSGDGPAPDPVALQEAMALDLDVLSAASWRAKYGEA